MYVCNWNYGSDDIEVVMMIQTKQYNHHNLDNLNMICVLAKLMFLKSDGFSWKLWT